MATEIPRSSQAVALAAQSGEQVTKASQISALAGVDGVPVSGSSQLVALAAFAPPATFKTQSSQLVGLLAREGQNISRSSQLVSLVAYRTGGRDNFTSRAWTFTLDGHEFYVLSLGKVGTFVYDISTGQWSQWRTAGLDTWNMEYGIAWKNRVIAGDNRNPTLWELDPLSELDDTYKSITRVVTGGLSTRLRTFVANYAFNLTASVGAPSVTAATVTLSYSDDQGNTFIDAGSITLTSDKTQELTWRSLGLIQPPYRIFKVTDVGGLVRIDGADAEVDGEDG